LDWPSEQERIARMDEGLQLIEQLVDQLGRYFSTNLQPLTNNP
jgi:hypothetical protein